MINFFPLLFIVLSRFNYLVLATDRFIAWLVPTGETTPFALITKDLQN
ncbi:hypothetical protein VDG1235_3664 [Verrucomicrobiia bacterium DG1235]|nr:hypothetical protein VDG1235_3664 [Verrucomicrobiae bacterium DG1235]